MKVVWKYGLDIVDGQSLIMPKGAIPLAVQMQRDELCLWVLCESTEKPELRYFEIRGTGHDCDDVGKYIGTVQMLGGSIAWHVFEGKAQP